MPALRIGYDIQVDDEIFDKNGDSITLNFKGAFNIGTTYKINDVVSLNDVMYRSISNSNLGHTPPNGTYWNAWSKELTASNSSVVVTNFAGVLTSSETDVQKALDKLDDHTHSSSQAFPVGSVFIAVVSTSPATLLGYGTWSQIAGGRVLIGQTGSDTDFDTAEETGGAKNFDNEHDHGAGTLALPNHSTGSMINQGGTSNGTVTNPAHGSMTGSTANAGSTAQSIMNPYFVVYIWKRTA